jgi:hypothetical protein
VSTTKKIREIKVNIPIYNDTDLFSGKGSILLWFAFAAPVRFFVLETENGLIISIKHDGGLERLAVLAHETLDDGGLAVGQQGVHLRIGQFLFGYGAENHQIAVRVTAFGDL